MRVVAIAYGGGDAGTPPYVMATTVGFHAAWRPLASMGAPWAHLERCSSAPFGVLRRGDAVAVALGHSFDQALEAEAAEAAEVAWEAE